MPTPVWKHQLETFLPEGHASKYNELAGTNEQAEKLLKSSNEDIIYHAERSGQEDFLVASIKMPSNEIKHFQFRIYHDRIDGKDTLYAINNESARKIESIADYIERKIFDEKVKMFAENLGKDTPEAKFFQHDSLFRYTSENPSLGMGGLKSESPKKSAEWQLNQVDSHTMEPYSTGKFLFSQPQEREKQHNFLDVSIKIAPKLVGHLRFELKDGGIYPEGKTDAANKIENMSNFIQTFSKNAASLVDQLDKRLGQIDKLRKNIKSSQLAALHSLEVRADEIKQQIADGNITDERGLYAAIDDKLKAPLSQIAKRGLDNQRYKLSDAVTKVKNLFRGQATRTADKMLREIEKPPEGERTKFRRDK